VHVSFVNEIFVRNVFHLGKYLLIYGRDPFRENTCVDVNCLSFLDDFNLRFICSYKCKQRSAVRSLIQTTGLSVGKREGWLLRMLVTFCDICFYCAEMKKQEFSNEE